MSKVCEFDGEEDAFLSESRAFVFFLTKVDLFKLSKLLQNCTEYKHNGLCRRWSVAEPLNVVVVGNRQDFARG